jgi:hypothetical protein
VEAAEDAPRPAPPKKKVPAAPAEPQEVSRDRNNKGHLMNGVTDR